VKCFYDSQPYFNSPLCRLRRKLIKHKIRHCEARAGAPHCLVQGAPAHQLALVQNLPCWAAVAEYWAALQAFTVQPIPGVTPLLRQLSPAGPWLFSGTTPSPDEAGLQALAPGLQHPLPAGGNSQAARKGFSPRLLPAPAEPGVPIRGQLQAPSSPDRAAPWVLGLPCVRLGELLPSAALGRCLGFPSARRFLAGSVFSRPQPDLASSFRPDAACRHVQSPSVACHCRRGASPCRGRRVPVPRLARRPPAPR